MVHSAAPAADISDGPEVTDGADRCTPLRRVHHVLHTYPALSPAIVLLLSVTVFSFLSDNFLTLRNLGTVAQQVTIVGTLAAGEAIVILTAGIDLSVGAVMILASVVTAKVATSNGVPALGALLIGLAVATLAGAMNGLLVTKLRLPPFIVTLGTLSIFTALTLLYAQGASIGDLPPLLNWTGTAIHIGSLGLTVAVFIMLLIYAVLGYALGQTSWGRHVYAVGDDLEAARLSGIRVNRVLLSVYTVAGLIFGITAWLQFARTGSASANAASDANLDSITAVVIGGISLFGGRGRLVGALIGASIVGVFRNGLSVSGVDESYRTLAIGVLVIVAVSVDQWIRKVRS